MRKSYVQNQMLGKALLESMMILNKTACCLSDTSERNGVLPGKAV